MKLNPYLNFNGECEAAFTFYEKCLGGKNVTMMNYGSGPMAAKTPPGWQNKIMHARLLIGDQVLMGSDGPSDSYSKPQGISVTLNMSDPAEAERIFHALSEGGAVQMPIQETFWAARFAMFTDRFGIPWMINCEKPV
jgi:PhnB protein